MERAKGNSVNNQGSVIAWVFLLVFAAAAVLFTDHILSGVLATALVASILAPQRRIMLVAQVTLLLGWVGLEFLAANGWLSDASVVLGCFGLPALIAVWLAVGGLFNVIRDHPRALRRYAIIVGAGGIAYLLPYIVATPDVMDKPLAGMGCLSFACDKTNLWYTAYVLEPGFAGHYSIAAVFLTAILGKWIFYRSLPVL